MQVGVIGLGRVGLPLSLVLAECGYHVIGVDTDPRKQQMLTRKQMPFKEEGAAVLLKKHVGKSLTLGSQEDLKKCQTIIICIGTFLQDDFTPDLSAVFKLFDEILPFVSGNTLLVLRSTVHPKGTEAIWQYIQKKTKKDLMLVYAPERIAEGFAVKELYTLPQIIGSFDKKSAQKGEELFQSFAPQILHSDPLSAELSKLMLNTYRYAKFALANELMMIVDYYDRDIHKVLELANTNYTRGGIPSPGFAAGPCLVKDSFFLRANTPFNTMITGSYAINNQTTDYLVQKLDRSVNLKSKRVAVLGLAFKKNIDDDRGSLSLNLIQGLQSFTKNIVLHDPYLSNTNLSDVLAGSDVVIVAVDHDAYKSLTKSKVKKLVGKKVVVCDIWDVLKTKKIFFEVH